MKRIFKTLLVISLIIQLSCKKEEERSSVRYTNFNNSVALENSMQPFLFTSNNELIMSWTQKLSDSIYTLKYSSFQHNQWSSPIEIARGNDWFVNWADFPAIAKNGEYVLAHYLQKSDKSTYAYDIHLKLSGDNGKLWSKDFVLHNDNTKTEHGFVTLLPFKGDSFLVAWLDGRNTVGANGHNENELHESMGAMTLRAAQVLSTGDIVNDTLIDIMTCDCCQTTAVNTLKGPVVVYRDRSEEEVRDIYISRMLDGSWTIPQPVYKDNWVINGCPVNGPKADTKNNTLVVSWFTAPNNEPKVNLAFSLNNGANFEKPIQIDLGNPLGRVDVLLIDDENALVSWIESSQEEAELYIVKVNKSGMKSKEVKISGISASRSSGFPQLELINNNAFLAWNDVDQNNIRIHTKTISLDVLE